MVAHRRDARSACTGQEQERRRAGGGDGRKIAQTLAKGGGRQLVPSGSVWFGWSSEV
jgi:hypothetical protein